MQVRENGRVQVVNANTIAGQQTDSATATGNLDLYPGDTTPPVYTLTNNLSGGVTVGVNTRNARRDDEFTLVRNSASPSANTVTVKSGTAAGGSTVATIAASKNGHVRLRFDGSAWKLVELAHTS